MNEPAPSSWVHEAVSLPLAFAQVREDPHLDLNVIQRLPPGGTVVMIASGGETACCLSRAAVGRLHLVDMNPAQLALTKLKLRLSGQAAPGERMRLLGHSPLPATERRQRLLEHFDVLNLPPDIFGPLDWVAEVGPDYAGRYERVFAHLNDALRDQTARLNHLLSLGDPVDQRRELVLLRAAFEAAFAEVMSLSNLVRLFGAEATRNPVRPFAEHFAERTCTVLSQLPAGTNPFLWQMLLGRFPVNEPYDWLKLDRSQGEAEVTFTLGKMLDVLDSLPAASCDFVHLSNILDWLSVEAATATLQRAHRVLKSDGLVLVRQLNSTLDIPALPTALRWDHQAGLELLRVDRSFFYKAIHLGCKR